MTTLEYFTHIPGYEGLYMVSDLGQVLSTRRNKMLSQTFDTKGYLQVTLCKEGRMKTYKVHRLVAEAFCEDFDPQLTVDHMNHIRTDNRASNLQMVSRSMNASRRCKIGKSSQYHGVTYHKQLSKWRTQIRRNKVRKHLGYFDTELEAAQAHDRYVLQNHLEEDYTLNDNVLYPEEVAHITKTRDEDICSSDECSDDEPVAKD